MTGTTAFGERLLSLLKQRKIKQLKVAEVLGVSRTAVNKWTKGGMIDDGNLERLAAFLEVDKIWLKYGEYASGTPDAQPRAARNINEVHLHDSADIVTWEWDLLTGKVHYSDNVESVYGVRLSSNDEFWDMMSEQAREKLVNGYSRIIREGGAHEMDFKIDRNGSHRWITSRATGVKGPNGKVTKLVGISLDNTERKSTELRLRKMKSYFDMLLKHLPHLVVFTDSAGEILLDNHESRSEKMDYLELQRLLYQLVLNNHEWLEQLSASGYGELVFQGRRITAYHHIDDERQPFLMFELR